MSWQYERSMTPGQFALAFSQLGMTQSECARFLGMSDRQCRRLVRGERMIGVPIVLLLNSMIAHQETPLVPRWVPGSY
jgi:plasmid maintenance system antidote protein VapI